MRAVYADADLPGRGQRLALLVARLVQLDRLGLGREQLHLALFFGRLLQHHFRRGRSQAGRRLSGGALRLRLLEARRCQRARREDGVGSRRSRGPGLHAAVVVGHAVRLEGHGGHGRWACGLAAAGLGVIGWGWYGGRAPPHVLCALVGSLGGDLARGEVLRGRGYEALAAHGGEAGLEVALRALSRAVAKMRAVYERRLALGGMHDGRARVVWGGCGCDSRGRLGRRRLDRGCRWVLVVHGRAARLLQCRLRAVRVVAIERRAVQAGRLRHWRGRRGWRRQHGVLHCGSSSGRW
jgi:hypothetical protein